MQKPQPVHWANLAIGRSNFSLSANVSSRDNTISVWLNITGEKAKEHYDILYTSYFEKSQIEVSPDIIWARLDNKKMCGIGIKLHANFNSQDDRNRQFLWFRDNLEKFTRYFKPIILQL